MRAAEVQEARRAADLSHDRERIAADIHDLAIQRLYAVALTLDTASRTGDRTMIGGAVDTIDDVVAELRGTIHNLRKPLGSATLSTTLGEIADIGLERGFSTDVRVSGDVDGLPVAVGVHLGAVLREAVSNALRHSGGDSVSIAVTATRDDISLVVADNGCGLPEDVDRSSLGLRNIRQRAEETRWARHLGPQHAHRHAARVARAPAPPHHAGSPVARPTGPGSPRPSPSWCGRSAPAMPWLRTCSSRPPARWPATSTPTSWR